MLPSINDKSTPPPRSTKGGGLELNATSSLVGVMMVLEAGERRRWLLGDKASEVGRRERDMVDLVMWEMVGEESGEEEGKGNNAI